CQVDDSSGKMLF
nr:immunoglobulin light chain junction region [Macaca mulatta]